MAYSAVSYVAPEAWRFWTQFLFFAGIAVSSGAAAVFTFGVRPAALRCSSLPDRQTVLHRGRLVVALSGAVLLLVIYPQLAGKVARGSDGMTFAEGLRPLSVARYLGAPAAAGEWMSSGALTALQFGLFAASAIALILVLTPALARHAGSIVAAGGLGVVVAENVTLLPITPEQLSGQDFITHLLTDIHPTAGCLWLGGVAALVGVATCARHLGTDGGALIWSIIWRRFALTAEITVAVLIISGIWVAWESVGAPSQFFTTVFGRVLLAKMTLVLLLLVIGGLNEFVLLPKIVNLREQGDQRPLFTLVARRFPKVVLAEVILGAGVLALVPFLSGSAREEAGGAADPAPTGGIALALILVAAIAAVSFIINVRFAAGHRKQTTGRATRTTGVGVPD